MRCLWLAAVLSVLGSVGANAVTYRDFVGTWAVQVADKNLLVLTLEAEGESLGGHLDFPLAMRMSKTVFSVSDPRAGREEITSAQMSGDTLVITMRNMESNTGTDRYMMRLEGANAMLARGNATTAFDATSHDLVRVEKGARLATDWERDYTYAFDGSNAPNAEMKALFAEDQRVRQVGIGDTTQGDADREARTRVLLAHGALHSGKDFEEAAFVFQHGETTDDYLLAHTLSMVAVTKGDKAAIWISAATLDRYLVRISQKQIYGTQYNRRGTEAWTQEPYDRNLVADSLRTALGVPTQAEQQTQLEAMNANTPRTRP